LQGVQTKGDEEALQNRLEGNAHSVPQTVEMNDSKTRRRTALDLPLLGYAKLYVGRDAKLVPKFLNLGGGSGTRHAQTKKNRETSLKNRMVEAGLERPRPQATFPAHVPTPGVTSSSFSSQGKDNSRDPRGGPT